MMAAMVLRSCFKDGGTRNFFRVLAALVVRQSLFSAIKVLKKNTTSATNNRSGL